jgi:hypothetical protein
MLLDEDIVKKTFTSVTGARGQWNRLIVGMPSGDLKPLSFGPLDERGGQEVSQ